MTSSSTAHQDPHRVAPRMGPLSRALQHLGYIPADNLGALVDSHRDDRRGQVTQGLAHLWDDLAQVERDRDEPWRADAACLDVPTSAFFSQPTDNGGRGTRDARDLAEELCATCPVREPCGMYADANDLQGVYGGRYRAGNKRTRRDQLDRAAEPSYSITFRLEVTQ